MGTRNLLASSGPCKIVITDRETGEIILQEEGYVTSFSERIQSSPIHVMGQFDPVETHYRRDVSVNFAFFPSYARAEHAIEKKNCDHQWVAYEGFVENFEYCKICDKRKDER